MQTKTKEAGMLIVQKVVQQGQHNWIYLVWLVCDTKDVFLTDNLFWKYVN